MLICDQNVAPVLVLIGISYFVYLCIRVILMAYGFFSFNDDDDDDGDYGLDVDYDIDAKSSLTSQCFLPESAAYCFPVRLIINA